MEWLNPRFAFGLVLLLVGISVAHAEEPAEDDDDGFDRTFLKTDPKDRTWIFFGTNIGYTTISPSASVRESSRDGYAVHLKVLGSKYFSDWMTDLGVGYQHHLASGMDEFSPLQSARVSVKTRSAFIELSPRYRVDENWQFGAVMNAFFGTDVSYGESVTKNTSLSFAAGPRLNWETSGEKTRWRFGAQVLRDIATADRAIWWLMADVQFGFAITKTPSAPEPAPLVTATPVAVETPLRPKAPKFAEITAEKGVKIYLGEAVLRFKTASAELRPSSREILVKVSKYLKQSPTAWSRVRVEGHADKRGKLDYNVQLSHARADRVKSELVKLGVPAKKLAADGFGPKRPIDPAEDAEAFALNRRVELWLDGVSDAETIVRDLNELH